MVLTECPQWFWFFEARSEPETAPFTLWYVGIPIRPAMTQVLTRFIG